VLGYCVKMYIVHIFKHDITILLYVSIENNKITGLRLVSWLCLMQ